MESLELPFAVYSDRTPYREKVAEVGRLFENAISTRDLKEGVRGVWGLVYLAILEPGFRAAYAVMEYERRIEHEAAETDLRSAGLTEAKFLDSIVCRLEFLQTGMRLGSPQGNAALGTILDNHKITPAEYFAAHQYTQRKIH